MRLNNENKFKLLFQLQNQVITNDVVIRLMRSNCKSHVLLIKLTKDNRE
jgi:hypothetical protein